MEQEAVANKTREEFFAKHKLESFKLGKGLPSSVAEKHSHARSHSRNASISSSTSFTTFHKSSNTVESSTSVNSAPSKRNSHHRRRSSVSTRIESAEMMGVSIPDLPPSTSENNVNLGEKDSIRRRALLALEGKPDMAFTKVEIPDMSTPVMEKMMFDLATKPSQSPNTVPSYGPTINSLMGSKRDSFKILGPSSSSKDQLHTLVEEEEEEEEDTSKSEHIDSSLEFVKLPSPLATLLVDITKSTPIRPRPANLNLRPLSLTPENLVGSAVGLPTPSLTPSPRPGLKALALVPSPVSTDITNVTTTRESTSPSPAPRRSSLNLNLKCENVSAGSNVCEDNKGSRRSSISYKSSSSNGGAATNFSGLPTPEMTPTSFDRRYSTALADALRSRTASMSSTTSGDEDYPSNYFNQSRPLSASEQHFLFKSHNALLARITDLEHALSTRRRSSTGFSAASSSRPVSVASDTSSSSEPSDEMLRLVADLKAERDELKRDVDGWRTRVGDMEKHMNILATRVETERRDAWVVRSMAGLLEVEKAALERKLSGIERTASTLEDEKKSLEAQNSNMKQRVASLEAELKTAQQALTEEKKAKLAHVFDTPETIKLQGSRSGANEKHNHWFASVDSESSTTDVEDSPDDSRHTLPLKAVVEDDESFSDEDNGLAGYEDELDEDASLQSSSSFGSTEDLPRTTNHLMNGSGNATPISATPRPATLPTNLPLRPTHTSRASLSKTWTFPIGAPSSSRAAEDSDVDHFFECLRDDDTDDSDAPPISPSAYSYEKSKGLFASGFQYDDNSPFFFPSGAGIEVESPTSLESVPEEEEGEETVSDENMFGEASGIRITFTPPEAEEDEGLHLYREPSPAPTDTSVPAIKSSSADNVDGIALFDFGRSAVSEPSKHSNEEAVVSIVSSSGRSCSDQLDVVEDMKELEEIVASQPSVLITPPPSLRRPTSPQAPSSIPRPAAIKSSVLFTDMATSTPPKARSTQLPLSFGNSPNAFVTPPNKRGWNLPSFIPQPISSPSPIRSVSGLVNVNAKNAALPKRSQRKLPSNVESQNNVLGGAAYGSAFAPQIPVMPNSNMNARSLPRFNDMRAAPARITPWDMKSVDLSDSISVKKDADELTASPTIPIRAHSHSKDIPSSFSRLSPTVPAGTSLVSSSPLSARISFRTFANFISIPWSQGDDTRTPTSKVTKPSNIPALNRAFVPKEKQLEKLRVRLERESKMQTKISLAVHCQKCDDISLTL